MTRRSGELLPAKTEETLMTTIFGLKNCDTCRKALKWLVAEGIEHRFHDVRADGLNGEMVDRWLAAAGWEALLNRRSTTWRDLPDADKQNVDAAKARELMVNHPTLVKRPVMEKAGNIHIGFTPAIQAALAV